MESLIALNPLAGPAADLLSVLGTIASTNYLLRRYITISSLLPPPPSDDSLPPPEPVRPKVTGWRRFFTRKGLKAFRDFIVLISVQWGVILGLPRLANQLVQDILWGTGLFIMMTFVVGCSSTVILPNPMKLSLERKTPTSGISLKEDEQKWAYSEHLRTVCSIALSLITLYSAYRGVYLPRPIITGLFAVQMSVLRFPRMSFMVKLISGMIVSLQLDAADNRLVGSVSS